VKIAVLGPGGVGGLIAGALARHGADVEVIARASTAARIDERGLQVSSVTIGDFVAHPRAAERLDERVDALIVATKALGLQQALERIAVEPEIVLPLLNGLDHLELLRSHFDQATVLAGAIRVEADRPEPGVVVHTSPFLRIDTASPVPEALPLTNELVALLNASGIPARVLDSEPQVMWSKLVRLNALACTTSAYDKLLGEIRSTPTLRADLVGAIEEGCAAGRAEGADVEPDSAVRELENAHETLGSSMQRDIAAGREPELDAIPGAVMRACRRHDLPCPTIERLLAMIEARLAAPAAD
jgi:2-dehydropantoate 2-reductase